MPEPEAPQPDGENAPREEGTLLFDPTGPDPLADDFGEGDDSGSSRARIGWLVGAVVVVGGMVGLQMLGTPDEPEEPADPVPVVTPVPVDTVSRAALLPLPADSVADRIGTRARIALRALDREGSPERNAVIRFTVDSGAGRLQDQEVPTTTDGIAVTFVQLPDVPGVTRVSATLEGSDLPPARFKVVAQPGPPARIARSGGDRQEAEVGRLLPDRAFVSVFDAADNPVPGALVTFRIQSGDGVTAPSQTRTDALGRAGALWRLGPLEGEQTLTASVSGVPGQVLFTATARPMATLEFDNPTPTETSPVDVRQSTFTMGASHACRLSGGSLSCRGSNERGQTDPSGPLGYVAVVAGSSHTCALSSNGIAACWGANEEGQLGDGTRVDRAQPTRVDTELRFSMLTAGESHTCGLAGNGVPLCWGENLSGQVGDGTRNNQTVPRVVGGGLGFREITAGWSHTCGVSASGNTFCWGQNNQGQLGDGSSLDRLQPTLVQDAVRGLVAGSAHTCGIADGRALCWGSNAFGEIGDGSGQSRRTPTPVTGLPGRAVDLAAGAVHTCALLADNRVFCWGQNRLGQLGDGSAQDQSSPVEVIGGLRFRAIYAGGASTCGITVDGDQYCWGLNQSGQLGDGTRMNRSAPVRGVG